jgi:hypothetical protein
MITNYRAPQQILMLHLQKDINGINLVKMGLSLMKFRIAEW